MLFERRSHHPVVLCVDDDRETLGALRRTLRVEDYEVLTAQGAAEALGWLEDVPIDVLITDQRMPGTLGTDLLREVQERFPGTARAILTAYRDPSLLKEGLKSGTKTFLFKPWNDNVLRETVRRLATKGSRPVA